MEISNIILLILFSTGIACQERPAVLDLSRVSKGDTYDADAGKDIRGTDKDTDTSDPNKTDGKDEGDILEPPAKDPTPTDPIVDPTPDPMTDMPIPKEPVTPPMKIKILSINVWTGLPDAIARDVKASGADIACLQEASVAETKDSAKKLGSEWQAVTPKSGSEYSILSRFPITRELGETNQRRGGVGAMIEVRAGLNVAVFCHHGNYIEYSPNILGIQKRSVADVLAGENRVRGPQMKDLLGFMKPYQDDILPVFLVGDFNAPSHVDYNPTVAWPISTMIHAAGLKDSYAELHPDNPKKYACQFKQNDPGITWARLRSEEPDGCFDRIDFIYYSGKAKPVTSGTLELPVSDHYTLYTEFEVNGP